MTSLIIPNSVTSIGSSAFAGCSGLTSLTIPNSVTSIGAAAFEGCSNLQLKTLATNPPTLEGDIGVTSIEVPVGSACNYAIAENWNLLETIYSVQNNVRLYPVPLYVNGESIVSVNGISELGVEVEEGQVVKIAKINDLASYGLVMQYNSNITDVLLDNGNYTFKASSHHKENMIETFAYKTQVVHVSESGTLLNQIGIPNIDNVYSLKVSGNLNGTDILAIRKMTNLKFLDMEDANIVDGGTSYYQDYVTSNNAIGDYFFKEKENFVRIILPKTITEIKSHAFDGCKNMITITVPTSVTSVGSDAFYGCSGLTSVTILCSTVGSWFNGMMSIKEVVFGEGVTSISNSAFNGCSGLTSVTIPNGVISIGRYAFDGCSGLASVTIPSSVTSIDDASFRNCTALTSVNIHDIAAWCNIRFYGSNSNPLHYAHHLFLNGEVIKDLVIPNSVTSIGSSAFCDCCDLTSVTIPNSVISIGSGAFKGCSGLAFVTIPNSVTSIGAQAFQDCSLTSVNIHDIAAWCNIRFSQQDSNPLYYAHHLYLNGEEIKDLVIPNSITSIGKYTFYKCSGLMAVTIPNSVTSIGYDAFNGCSGLTSMTIGNSVKSIETSAFYDCSSMTSVTLLCPTVGSWFNGMTSIKEIIFGEGVTSIGERVFQDCNDLASVTSLNTTPPEIQSNTFSEETYTKATLKVPVGCQTIYWLHPYWENFSKIEEIDTSGIDDIIANEDKDAIEQIYTIDGKPTDVMQRGLNIIRMKDGTTKKVWVK